jgi:hypothetical protein
MTTLPELRQLALDTGLIEPGYTGMVTDYGEASEEITAFYAAAFRAGMLRAAEIAEECWMDGTSPAAAIRREAEQPGSGHLSSASDKTGP